MARTNTATRATGSQKSGVTTSLRARLLLSLGGVAFAIVIAEVVVRALVPPQPLPRITDPPGYPPVDNIGELYVYRPGVHWSHVYDVEGFPRTYLAPDGRITYRINNLGLRGENVTPAKPSGVRRILCVGDSVTFGEGVREEDTWPVQLARRLGPAVETINAGIQGYDFNLEALYLLRHGRQLQPDAVVVAFFMNDAMQSRTEAEHHYLVTESAGAGSALARASATWALIERQRRASALTKRYLADLRDSFRSDIWRDMKGRIHRLRQMGELGRFKVVAVVFPLLFRLHDYPLAAEHAEVVSAFSSAGIEVVDLLPALRAFKTEELWVHPVDPHPNESVHRIAAERLARLPVIQGTDAR